MEATNARASQLAILKPCNSPHEYMPWPDMPWPDATTLQLVAYLHMISMELTIAKWSRLCTT
jgi:hypothetical protein